MKRLNVVLLFIGLLLLVQPDPGPSVLAQKVTSMFQRAMNQSTICRAATLVSVQKRAWGLKLP